MNVEWVSMRPDASGITWCMVASGMRGINFEFLFGLFAETSNSSLLFTIWVIGRQFLFQLL